MLDTGRVSKTSANRLIAAWRGRRLRERKASLDKIREEGISAMVGDARFVCTVTTHDMAAKTAEERALLAARLALASLALMWAKPSAELDGLGLNYDGGVIHRHTVTLDQKQIRSLSSSVKRHREGPTLPSDWAEIWEKAKGHLRPIGEAVTAYVDPGYRSAQPAITNALFHSVMWFHEACREPLPLVATVKFAASMDALTSENGEQAVARMLNARMNIPLGGALMKDGRTATQALEPIFRARSRTIHGNNDKITEDWHDIRDLAEHLARRCIHVACQWINENPFCDDLGRMSV